MQNKTLINIICMYRMDEKHLPNFYIAIKIWFTNKIYNIIKYLTGSFFVVFHHPEGTATHWQLAQPVAYRRYVHSWHLRRPPLREPGWCPWSRRRPWWCGSRRRSSQGAHSPCPSSPRPLGTSDPTAPDTREGPRSPPGRGERERGRDEDGRSVRSGRGGWWKEEEEAGEGWIEGGGRDGWNGRWRGGGKEGAGGWMEGDGWKEDGMEGENK